MGVPRVARTASHRSRLQRLLLEHEEVAVGQLALSQRTEAAADERLPAEIRCTIGADLAMPGRACRHSLLAELKHLASLHNPLFYERQRLRLSTHQTPRLIRCYEEDLTHLRFPRGLLRAARGCSREAGSRLVTEDRRANPRAAPARVPRRADPAATVRGSRDARARRRRSCRPARNRQDRDRLRADRRAQAADARPRPQQAAARAVASSARKRCSVSPRSRSGRTAAGGGSSQESSTSR